MSAASVDTHPLEVPVRGAGVLVVEPAGGVLGTFARRVREVPWLAVPFVLDVVGGGFAVRAWTTDDARWLGGAAAAGGLAALVGFTVWMTLGDRFRRPPPAPDDAADPIELERWCGGVTWTDGRAAAHLLPDRLRIVGSRARRRDLPATAALALPGAGGMYLGVVATLLCVHAAGIPRPRRVQLDLSWDEVGSVHLQHHRYFCVLARDGRLLAVVEARYGRRDRLAAALGERLVARHERPAGVVPPPPLPAEDEDEAESGVAEVLLRRGRHRGTVLAALALLLASVALHTLAHFAGGVAVRLLGMAAGVLGWFLALVAAARVGSAWKRDAPGPGDRPDPVAVRWTNRPGWAARNPQYVHVLPEGFRIVAREYETWDVLVVAAATVTTVAVGVAWPGGFVWGLLAASAVPALFSALGVPRRRRFVVDVPWDEVERVEVHAWRFALISRLPEPAARIEFQANYSLRELLASELVARLGERFVPSDPEGRRT